MQWNSLEQFLAMGGYAAYVWGSYLVAAAAIALEVVLVRARRRTAVRDAERIAQAERGR